MDRAEGAATTETKAGLAPLFRGSKGQPALPHVDGHDAGVGDDGHGVAGM